MTDELKIKREVVRLLYRNVRANTAWQHRKTQRLVYIFKVYRRSGTVLVSEGDGEFSLTHIVEFNNDYERYLFHRRTIKSVRCLADLA